MMKLLCLDDFKHKKINPNWSPSDILLQVTEVDQLTVIMPPEFNNGVGLKRKRTLTTLEEEDDREWEAPKPKLKRNKKQHKAVCQLPPPGM
ncbi:hypothetical protein Goari_018441 [Gossypium aridum]|uniref:Uncharacterized protein n=1 Tax=Gossypium aridum TaxID=34290 RepID=A0A7J8WPZ3_GOSAI|nr:hypothetical protein [Gossypium aridum]